MSYRTTRRFGFSLIIVLLVLIGLIPSYLGFKIREKNSVFITKMQVMDLAIDLQNLFWKASTEFNQVDINSERHFESVISYLDKAIEISKNLEELLISAEINDEIEHVDQLQNQTKLFKLAIIQFKNEFLVDPTADNTFQMETISSRAQVKNNEIFSRFMADVVEAVKKDQLSIEQTFKFGQVISINILIFGVFAGCLVTIYTGRALHKPIKELVLGTEKIASGDLNYRIDNSDSDEIGRLSIAFNKMGEKIKSSFDEQQILRQIAEEAAKSEKIKTEELKKLNKQMAQEISTRKKAEASVIQALKNTKKILESMPFGVFIVGRDKKIRSANKTALKLMGLESEQEIVNKICHSKICPAELNKCPVLDLGQSVDSSERVLIDKNGKHIPILKTVIPLNYEGEDVLLESFMDISRLKQVEGQLKIAKLEAEEANSAKSNFLSNMSHELRTPLNHIIGFSELIIDKHFGALTESQEEYLNDILNSGRHLLSLINDILDLSKIEAGKMALDISSVDLSNLLKNSLTIIKEKAQKHSIQVNLDIKGIHENILADERKLKQIIYNLLSNAVKFTPDGGFVSVATKVNGNNEIKISVSDTGIGVKPDNLDRIFLPFEQVDNSNDKNIIGTGLGLSLTKQLVELHSGKIWAESDGEGCGTTFNFTLPANPPATVSS